MANRRRRIKKPGEHSGGGSAADIKELTERLTEFTPDELRQIPVVPVGTPLKEGAVYLDLQSRAFGPFVATGRLTAGEHHLYVPKAEVPDEYWNRLLPKQDQVRKVQKAPSEEGALSESMIDKTLADSFPTSDPPSWTTGREKE